MQVEKIPFTPLQSKSLASLMSHEGWLVLLDLLSSRAADAAITASEIRLRSVGAGNQSLVASAAENENRAAVLSGLYRELLMLPLEREEDRYTINITP